MKMKEFLTIIASFLVIVGFSFYMYVGNQKHSSAMIENNKLQEIIEKNHQDLKQEMEVLRTHMILVDSIYHKK